MNHTPRKALKKRHERGGQPLFLSVNNINHEFMRSLDLKWSALKRIIFNILYYIRARKHDIIKTLCVCFEFILPDCDWKTMPSSPCSLSDFLLSATQQKQLSPQLSELILGIASTCQTLSHLVRKGALAGVLGEAGSGNVQGEAQKKLDVLANDCLISALQNMPSVAAMASEELEDAVLANSGGQFLVLFDPLDGSSNIDINVSVGTIFSILPAGKCDKPLSAKSFLQKGREQLAAGYVLYGPQTILVLTFGFGVASFTLDPDVGEFFLTSEQMRIPETTAEFAINMSNQRHWEAPVQSYVAELLAGKTGARGRDFNMRWIASMVAEVHRILTRGGVFLYPKDARDPSKPGKLRLMYEANPMSFLVEQAGGAAINAHQVMLDITPQHLHERVSVMLGSREEIEKLLALHQK